MKILKNIGLLLVSFILSYLTNIQFHELYLRLYGSSLSGIFSFYDRVGEYSIALFLGYLFFLILLFAAFGDKHKYWWAGIAAIPALAFLLYFDLSHIYFHILFPLAGWLIGWGIGKLLPRRA